MKVYAVVLAGAPNAGKLKSESEERWEALIPVGGKPMVSHVVSAISASDKVEETVVVGPEDLEQHLQQYIDEGACGLTRSGRTLMDNLLAGITGLDDQRLVLVSTSDIPMLTTEMVDDFLDRCSQMEADFWYSVVLRQVVESRFPEVRRTYARLKDGTFTGGNVMLAKVGAIKQCAAQAEDWISNRKNVLKLVSKLGLGFILKFLTGRITIRDVENRVSFLFGIRARAVVTPYAEIGVDVDKPSDLRLVKSEMEGKSV